MELLLVSMASLLAGFVDAIVGGGGLILVPALFAIFPGTHPATLFGVNKSASIWGTAMAALQYSRKVQLSWSALLPAAAAGFAGSFAGAWAVTVVSPEFLRKLLPLILLGVLAYTLARKDLGRHHVPQPVGAARSRGGGRHRAGAGLLRRLLRPRHGQLFRLPVRALARL